LRVYKPPSRSTRYPGSAPTAPRATASARPIQSGPSEWRVSICGDSSEGRFSWTAINRHLARLGIPALQPQRQRPLILGVVHLERSTCHAISGRVLSLNRPEPAPRGTASAHPVESLGLYLLIVDSSGDTTPCRMTGVTLHGVVSPEKAVRENHAHPESGPLSTCHAISGRVLSLNCPES